MESKWLLLSDVHVYLNVRHQFNGYDAEKKNYIANDLCYRNVSLLDLGINVDILFHLSNKNFSFQWLGTILRKNWLQGTLIYLMWLYIHQQWKGCPFYFVITLLLHIKQYDGYIVHTLGNWIHFRYSWEKDP